MSQEAEARRGTMLDDVRNVPWASFAQPEWNDPNEVPSALRALSSCTSEEEALRAYHKFLYAVGNNHSGSYYPVVLPALPFLARILESDNEIARRTTLDVLIDLLGSFGPEPGFEFEGIDPETGLRGDLRALLHSHARIMVPVTLAIASDRSPARLRSAALAAELAEALLEDADS
ncbi:hypothetical protein [Polyangium jinanense]|uniref:Uncharacterized protein n=1 Tax=Polyangium jinanense TaxID=2829994 RepID=A0A9X4ARZ5_9BACT|nr:hypothetical protein [Polyangium jinanense]MDC3954048.1 hypothetical protein [Polyangium jinanense]MDC3981996.1 hypothetical protein [Polyangium jinanense]